MDAAGEAPPDEALLLPGAAAAATVCVVAEMVAVAVVVVVAVEAPDSSLPFRFKLLLLLHCIALMLTGVVPNCLRLIVATAGDKGLIDVGTTSRTTGGDALTAATLGLGASPGKRSGPPLSVGLGLGSGTETGAGLESLLAGKEDSDAACAAACALADLVLAQGAQNMAACSRNLVTWSMRYSCTHFARLPRGEFFPRSPFGDATWDSPSGRVAPHLMHTQHRSQLQRPSGRNSSLLVSPGLGPG